MLSTRFDAMPEPLRRLADTAGRIGGGVIAFDSQDNMAYVNDKFASLYDFRAHEQNHTYKSLVYHGVNINRIVLNDNASPDDYIAMATATRRYNATLDFVKSYADGKHIGHHRQVAGWSVQVRLPLNDPRFWRAPGSLAEAIDMADGVSRERRALDALAVGVVMIGGGAPLWTNAAARRILADISPQAQSRLAAWAASNPRGWATLPNPRDAATPIIASAAPIGDGESVLMLAPRADLPALTDALAAVAGLSPTESAVAALIGAGATVDAAASELGWSRGAIQALVGGRIYKKIAGLTATSQAGLARLAWRLAAISRRF